MKIYLLSTVLCAASLTACTSVPLKTNLDGRSCPVPEKSAGFNALNANAAAAPLANTALLASPISPVIATTPSPGAAEKHSNGLLTIAQSRINEAKADSTKPTPGWLLKYETRTAISAAEYEAANKAVEQVNMIRARAFGALAELGEQADSRVVASHEMKFTRKDAELLESIQEVSAAGGYEVMYFDGQREFRAATGTDDKTAATLAFQKVLLGRFLADYFYAYARGGQFLQVSVAVDDTQKKISEKAEDALKNLNLTDATKKKLADAITAALKGVCKDSAGDNTSCLLTKPLGADSFVSRAGMSVQFAGIELTFGKEGKLKPATSYPKPKDFGPQLARVFLEAVFDSVSLVPATANATACTVEDSIYKALGLCLAEGDTNSKKIANVDLYSAQAEATVSALAGKAIRGISWAALNNEAVADTVETMAGVTARKLSEVVLWKLWEHSGACSETGNPFIVSVGD